MCDKNKNIKYYIIYSFYTKNFIVYIIYIIISRYIKRKCTESLNVFSFS